MPHRVTLIPGDGIGPEVVEAARRAIEATGVGLDWDVRRLGNTAAATDGSPLPPATLEAIRTSRVALKGPLTAPIGAERSINVTLRQQLDLYACIRPCRLYPGVPSAYEAVDLVVVRENTEDMYTGIEFAQGSAPTEALIGFIAERTGHRIREDSGISIKTNSVRGSDRVVRAAFSYAKQHERRLVTAGHKANIMKFSDGLFLAEARRVAAEEFPDVAFEDRIIDALTMQLIQAPDRFDVLVLPNLYGDIVSALVAGQIGGLGVAPGGHFGDDVAVFEATHGSAPKYAGQNRANPMGMLLSGAMMLRHLGERAAADALEGAITAVVAEGLHTTADIREPGDDRPAGTTSGFADAVIAALGSMSVPRSLEGS